MVYLIYLITGILSGIMGGLLGTGGCALMMPVIRFGFNFDPAIAVGTTLTAVVFTAASGAIQHIKMGNVEGETAKITGYSGVLGVIIGSVVFNYVKNYGDLIDLIIGIAFIIVSLRMLYEGLQRRPSNSTQNLPSAREIPGSPTQKSILGSIIGFLTGIIGLGGGYALVPSYLYLFKAPMKLAIGTSMASFIWMALVGAIFKLAAHTVNIPVAVALGIGAVIGAIYGAKLVARFSSNTLKFLFGLLFLYVSLKYIFIYFGIHI
ncbi:Sulfite exporter TauE/SafE [Neomoorella glycerini]|uniref:Probable membrane transporter protein n=1 Tax=Neomoorella glycerini TaxID=55779 RepID=A0A6I5ZTF6_9FIRM|nr:sulfite exporter TauE/SafE family protein [Moorella glycerini]QGP93322.1 Sulfite exporter TauE/SafE [Moorella glycerini]